MIIGKIKSLIKELNYNQKVKIIVVACIIVLLVFIALITRKQPVIADEVQPPATYIITNEDVIVEIRGAVIRPGIYMIEPSKRLYNLISLAGGLTDNADLTGINLATKVSDGMLIIIPFQEEEQTISSSPSKISLNKATVEELMLLEGIGITKAEKIIAYREEKGGFKTIEEILNVEGIKEATYLKIKDLITI